jgi:hypothetical protein
MEFDGTDDTTMFPDYNIALGPSARARVARLARVENAPGMQDWPLEVADRRRVGDFLRIYESAELDPSEKRALMALIVYSYDEIDEQDDRDWPAIRRILVTEAKLHAGLIVYWSCVVLGGHGRWYFEIDDHCFHLTPKLRPVLREVLGEIDFPELDVDHPAVVGEIE